MPTTITSAGITFNDATSLTSANIGTAQLANGSVTAAKLGTNEQTRIAKAWVNFNGTTSPGTIRSSYNVSSVTKNGTGDYTVNFATPMSDANYSVSNSYRYSSTGDQNATLSCPVNGTDPTTSSIRLRLANAYGGGSGLDTTYISVQVFGN